MSLSISAADARGFAAIMSHIPHVGACPSIIAVKLIEILVPA
jgi:hypothetical protein